MNKSFEFVTEYCEKNWKQNVMRNKALCDDLLDNTFIFNMPWDMEAVQHPVHFDGKVNWLYKPGVDMEFTWQFNRHRFLINLGQQYAMTGDRRYADKIVALMSDWIDNVKLADDTGRNKAWRSLEVGLRGATWLHALRYLKDCPSADAAFWAKVEGSLREHLDYLDKYYAPHNRLSNWGVIQMHGMFGIACYLGERDHSSGMQKVAFDRLCEHQELQILRDGVHWEQSPMYHTEVLNCFLDTMIFAREYGVELPQSYLDNIHRMARVLMYWAKPNGYQPNMGDSDNTHLGDILSRCALLFNDGEMKYVAGEFLDYETAWIFGVKGIEEYNKIVAVQPNFTNVFLEDSGNYILREDWSDTANYLHFNNEYTGAGHAHMDKLHFDLCVGGKDILTDSGRYTYVPSPIRKSFKSAKSHNTIAINHREFMRLGAGMWGYTHKAKAIKHNAVDTDEVSLIGGSHLGYLSFLGGGVITRKILWIKPNIYLLIDSCDIKGINSVQRYFNFAPDVKLDVKADSIVATNGNASATLHFVDGKKFKVIKSEYSHQYNAKQPSLTAKESGIHCGFADRTMVIDCCGAEVTKSPLKRPNGSALSYKKGCYLTIKAGGDLYEVAIFHDEVMSVTYAGEHPCCGKILVWKNNERIFTEW